MSKANPTASPLGTFQIYRQALSLPSKNSKLILHVVLIYIITTILLATTNQVSTQSITVDIAMKLVEFSQTQPTDSMYNNLYTALMKDIKEFAAIELVFVIISFFITTAVKIAIIYAFFTTHTENHVTLKELVSKVKGNLRGPFITQFLVSLLSFGYPLLLLVVLSFFWFIGNGSLLGAALTGFAGVAASIWFLYLTIWWVVSVIVSVVEEGCFGVGAFKRASDVMQGRKKGGVEVFVLYVLLSVVLALPFGFVQGSFIKDSFCGRLVIQWIEIVMMGVIHLLFLAAMTVYYYECKKGHEVERFWVDGKTVYTSLPAVDTVV